MSNSSNAETLLTVGEAAEFAGVALLELREHIRSGRLLTIRGQRLGDELALLSLESLVYIYPSAARRRHRPLRGLAERGISVIDGRRAGGAGVALPVTSVGSFSARDKGRDQIPKISSKVDASSPVAGEVKDLNAEIERLRREVELARDQKQVLLGDLVSASADAQRVLDDEREPALRRRRRRDRIQREQADIDRQLHNLGGGRSALGWFAGGLAIGTILLLAIWFRRPAYAASASVEPPAADASLLRESAVIASLREGARVEARLAATRRAQRRKQNAELVPPSNVEAQSSNGGPENAGVIGASEAQDSQAAAQLPAAKTPGVVADNDALVKAPISNAEACEVFPLTGLGQPLRDILGPCLGAWNPSKEIVVGSYRQDNKLWCAHHSVVARQLNGSIVRAKEIADFAIGEGLVPPLLQLRIDRAAAQFLEARTGTWVESGFESGTPADHKLTRLVGRDRWRLESWVRTPDADGDAQRRVFRMQVELNGSEWLDRELEFEWLE